MISLINRPPVLFLSRDNFLFSIVSESLGGIKGLHFYGSPLIKSFDGYAYKRRKFRIEFIATKFKDDG